MEREQSHALEPKMYVNVSFFDVFAQFTAFCDGRATAGES